MPLTIDLPAVTPGYSLPRDYYVSPAIFELDLEKVFANDWLYVGHISQMARSGDYITYEIAGESIVIARNADGGLHAFYNVCRHRGARILHEPCGQAKLLRCPYHNWTYKLDGSLHAAPGMSEQLDATALGLHPAHLDVWQGFIYVHMGSARPSTTVNDRLQAALPAVAGHQLEHLKIAKTIVYEVPANWKLIMENYRECYHCRAAHPQFCATVPVDALDANRADEGQRLVKDRFGTFTKYGLRPGAVSQSVSGDAVSVPLGDLTYDETILRGLSLYPGHAFVCGVDYGFAFGLQPRSATATTLTAHWYVNERAEAGRDYDPDKVAEFWDVTTRQDIFLCTINQQGVQSRRYVPGPLHAGQEDDVALFHDYYLEKLRAPS